MGKMRETTVSSAAWNVYKSCHNNVVTCIIMWQSHAGRKRTLFNCKWVNLINYIPRMFY